MNLPEKIYVTVTYPGGFISFFAHWWQNDGKHRPICAPEAWRARAAIRGLRGRKERPMTLTPQQREGKCWRRWRGRSSLQMARRYLEMMTLGPMSFGAIGSCAPRYPPILTPPALYPPHFDKPLPPSTPRCW